MTLGTYSQIVSLKNQQDDIRRGRDFEMLIREIQPWDHRPPIVSSQDSEQLDGVFIYKGLTFIIESKAVKKTITPGMHEWEDFELKLRRRKEKRIVGLFCCLFDVSDKIVERAKEMNMEGIQTIVIAGKHWDDLYSSDIYFPSFLDYMMQLSTLKNKPIMDSMKNVNSWIYDCKSIGDNFINNSKKVSSSFLRRFKHKFHDQLFVERNIDTQIEALVQALAPQSLRTSISGKTKDSAKQILIVRDFSGSGKTTLSVNLTSNNDHSYCFATTANLNLIDEVLDKFLDLNKYPKYGINELLAVNKPFLFIIDSLDETQLFQHVHKRKEIKSLLKKVEELNSDAQKNKLALFPIILMFTIREEYWRDWEASFEGRQDVVQLKKILSNYNPIEFQDALKKYGDAYNYEISNHLNKEAENILSVPINLEIFSEANHYEGHISVHDIWEGKILSSYFSKKEEALSKHYIERFNSKVFYALLCLLANKLLTDKTSLFSKADFTSVAGSIYPELAFSSDQILINLISEQLIINDIDNVKNFRFKYTRFVEYLAALHIIIQVELTKDLRIIDPFIQVIYDSNLVSIYAVLYNIKHICRTQYKDIENDIIEHYSHSDTFLRNYLPELRGKIARGEKIPEDVIKTIITNNLIQSAETSWNTFFIVAAKNVDEKKEIIMAAFVLAWETNGKHTQRWKLINKLAGRGWLLEERLIFTMFRDSNSRDWEEYFGNILAQKLNNEFLDIWTQIDGLSIFHKIIQKNPYEWQYANRLLDLIFRGEGYILGDIFSDEGPKSYVTFETLHTRKLPVLSTNDKKECDDFVSYITELFSGQSAKGSFEKIYYNELNKEEKLYVNITLEYLFQGKYGVNDLPFVNYIIQQLPETSSLVRIVLENDFLEVSLNETDKNGTTLFMEIIDCNYENKLDLFQNVFSRGYKKNQIDESYVSEALKNINQLNAKKLEDLLFAYSFLRIKNVADYKRIIMIYRELCTIFSAKYNRIINFRYTNLVQVANNGLEHYKEFTALLMKAFYIYQRQAELETKPSYLKKVEALSNFPVPQSTEFDSVLSAIFPELF